MGFDPISLGLGVVQGLTSLGGLLGGNAAKRRAEQARQQALTDLSGQLDTDYQNLYSRDQHGLLAATGQGGDAIASLGRNLGSSLAGAGVYNSSATAGALAQATASGQSSLAQLGSQNFYNEQSLLNSNRRYLTGLKLNLANQQYGEAQDNLSGARSGLSSFLGSLGQFNIARSGQGLAQNSLSRAAGGYGSSSVLDPAAGFNGALSTFNASPFSLGNFQVKQPPQFGLGGYNPNGY